MSRILFVQNLKARSGPYHLDKRAGGRTLPIIDNNETSVKVLGPTQAMSAGDPFEILSLFPSATSPVIDAAGITQAFELMDMRRQAPWDDLLVDDAGEGIVPFSDIGPYEYVP